jgi:hypothetical protein
MKYLISPWKNKLQAIIPRRILSHTPASSVSVGFQVPAGIFVPNRYLPFAAYNVSHHNILFIDTGETVLQN